MSLFFRFTFVLYFAASLLIFQERVSAADAPLKFALVISGSQSAGQSFAGAENNAGYIAGALAAQGFSVLGAKNLDHAQLKATLLEFTNQIQGAPLAELFVYFVGPIAQFGRDNFFFPTDAESFSGDTAKTKAVSITDLIAELSRLTVGPKTIALDGAHVSDPSSLQPSVAAGLAITANKTGPNTLILYSQAPGLVLIDKDLQKNNFTLALSEAITNASSLPLSFNDFVTLRGFELSEGRQVPWSSGQLQRGHSPFSTTDDQSQSSANFTKKPMNTLDPVSGFALALTKPSIASYEEYILIHIQNPMTRISHHLLAFLREERTWQEAQATPNAGSLWAYLKRYPRGPHSSSARSQLKEMNQPQTAPADAPILGLQTTPPTSDELALLASAPLYQLDATNAELKDVAAQIRNLLPKMADKDRDLPKLNTPAGPFDLPTLPNTSSLSGKIQTPASLANMPALPPVSVTVDEKTNIPLPPKRQSAPITIKSAPVPAETSSQAVDAEPAPTAPAPPTKRPKPILPQTFGDVFDDSTGIDVRPGLQP